MEVIGNMSALSRDISTQRDTVILGGGPAGLASAWALEELGRDNYYILEKSSVHGGNPVQPGLLPG